MTEIEQPYESEQNPDLIFVIEGLKNQREQLPKGNLSFFVSSLLELEEATKESINVNAFKNNEEPNNRDYISQFDHCVYSSPSIPAALKNPNINYSSLIQNIATLQSAIHTRIKQAGITLIYPNNNDQFNPSQHESSDSNLVWINDQPELNNQIHSVVRHGYIGENGQVYRQASVRKYVYSEPSTDSIDEDEEIRRAANPSYE